MLYLKFLNKKKGDNQARTYASYHRYLIGEKKGGGKKGGEKFSHTTFYIISMLYFQQL